MIPFSRKLYGFFVKIQDVQANDLISPHGLFFCALVLSNEVFNILFGSGNAPILHILLGLPFRLIFWISLLMPYGIIFIFVVVTTKGKLSWYRVLFLLAAGTLSLVFVNVYPFNNSCRLNHFWEPICYESVFRLVTKDNQIFYSSLFPALMAPMVCLLYKLMKPIALINDNKG